MKAIKGSGQMKEQRAAIVSSLGHTSSLSATRCFSRQQQTRLCGHTQCEEGSKQARKSYSIKDD